MVLDHLFGADWKEQGLEVEFRALDGYVSRIPSERFQGYDAYLVYDRLDQEAFMIDNPGQNEEDVPLGPYYLIWDTVRHPDLLIEGATYWPYQVSEVRISRARLEALLPGNMANLYAEEAALMQKHCLPCHQINGFGGDKWPIDVAQEVKEMTKAEFAHWVLTPNAVKPGTTMPPLAAQSPDPERRRLASRLFEYLNALPEDKQ